MRPLKSGKEAAVYVVRAGDDVRCAKVYKDMAQRSFQQRVQYQEGRKVRGSREARAIGKASKYGRKQQETAWKNTEVDALYQLRDAGVRVPEPYGYFHGVLVMELVTDADGLLRAAPGRGGADAGAGARVPRLPGAPGGADAVRRPDPRRPVGLQRAGRRRTARWSSTSRRWSAPPATTPRARCCCATSTTSPPASAAGRRNCSTPGTARRCGRCSRPASCSPTRELTGAFVHDERTVDLDGVRDAINDAREEALIRQQGREEAQYED